MNNTKTAEHNKANADYIAKKSKMGKNLDVSILTKYANERIELLFGLLSTISEADINKESSYVSVVDFLVSLFDDIVLECALLTGQRAEVEERIIVLCEIAKAKADKENCRDINEEHIVLTLLDGLDMRDDSEIKLSVIHAALLHETNPLRLGLCKYKSYIGETNNEVQEYLFTEERIRMMFLQGDAAQATLEVEKLANMKINTPEKYLFIALNSYYNGFVDDAKKAIRIGLHAFPASERLKIASNELG